MAISLAFLIVTAARALIILSLFKENVQATRAGRNNKYFGHGVINSQDFYRRKASVANVLHTIEKESVQNQYLEVDADEPDLESIESSLPNFRETVVNHRSKRNVFARDDRREVPKSYMEKCPFEAAVMISTGCSGVLVSPKHVLTSAHCLHNGSHYVDGYRDLRVGFLLRNGTTDWRPISYTKMPKQWKNGSDPSATMYDYALIKLVKNHSRCFLPIAPSTTFYYKTACAHKAIHFTAFDEDRKEGTMLYRKCRVVDLNATMLFLCCDAERGSSGAGVYELHRKHGSKTEYQRYVVGVFSGNRDIVKSVAPSEDQKCRASRRFICGYFRNHHGLGFRWKWCHVVNYNAALRLKESDVFHICTWMKRMGGELCKKIIRERRRRRRQSRKRRDRSRDHRCQGML